MPDPATPATPAAPVALVTGASSGIGMELARLLAADGYRLILVARNEAALGALAEELRRDYRVQVDIIREDLSDPAASRRIFERVEALGVKLDCLINNAGFGIYGRFDRTSYTETLRLIQVNCTAVAALMHLFLPDMIARGQGRILNVASMAGFLPGPLMAAYYASKAFVLSLSEAIHAEVRKKGVTVTALCPGPVATEFHTRAKVGNSLLFRGNLMTARRCAQIGYRAMLRGRRVVIAGWKNRLLYALMRLSPRAMVIASARKLNESR
jgi:short-subunit dehydrogenase